MKVIVFTAIVGRCDSLKPAPSGADRAVLFTDRLEMVHQNDDESLGWQIAYVSAANPRRHAWELRCRPHNYLAAFNLDEGDRSIWIDASYTLTDLPKLIKDASGSDIAALPHQKRKNCYEEGAEIIRIGQAGAADVQRQLDGYRREGFAPESLSVSCIIVRTNAPRVIDFNERWSAEIQKHPGDNTQISLEYCAWKAGLSIKRLTGTRHTNPYAQHDHADHKRQRQPYDTDVKVNA